MEGMEKHDDYNTILLMTYFKRATHIFFLLLFFSFSFIFSFKIQILE